MLNISDIEKINVIRGLRESEEEQVDRAQDFKEAGVWECMLVMK